MTTSRQVDVVRLREVCQHFPQSSVKSLVESNFAVNGKSGRGRRLVY